MSKEIALSQYGMKKIPVLDKGYVMLVDLMGDDQAIVDAARVSYGKGTRHTSENRGLIRYLIRHKHTSPLEMAEIKLQIKLPLFTAAQMVRHRTASLNSKSYRYSEADDDFYVPKLDTISGQDSKNRQARGKELPLANKTLAQECIASHQAAAYEQYKSMLNLGVARELARIELPQSCYTEWVWKIDLKNLLHFVRLRADEHSQYEIRVYADAIGQILKVWVPLVWDAFMDYDRNAHTFSENEIDLLQDILLNHEIYSLDKEKCKTTYGLSDREVRTLADTLNLRIE